MKLVLISDTHEQHDKVTIPECDVLVHAGDFTYKGDLKAINNSLCWLHDQPAKHKVFVAGNHDFLFERNPSLARELLTSWDDKYFHYLENSEVTIDGVKFYGSPITPWFYDWAFNVHRGEAIRKIWDKIPDDTDVLITHGPPFLHGDTITPNSQHLGDTTAVNSEHLGCFDLFEKIQKVMPRFHVFGHIHGGYGESRDIATRYYNASICDEKYRPVNKPFIVEF